ncbi:hypothetical protein BDR03DRAFT_1019348 [Suillus americanus]|nr:hypothetical protein BDR03DRAFT_1019348 [Suillus americanus]
MNQTYTSVDKPLKFVRLESLTESVPVAILTQGFYKYGFLQASVCEVAPLLTTVRADYSDQEISAEVISSTPFQPENAALLSFIASVAKFQSVDSQGLTSSTIGDTLYSIYSSTTNESINDNLNDTQVYFELEDYWRGVVEFFATFLRSEFMATGSFPNNEIPNNLSSQVTGTMFVSTIGWIRWAKKSPTYLLATLPLTIVTILTLFCASYSVLETWKERHGYDGHHRAHFDVPNTLHLIVACAAGSLALQDFGKGVIINNESVKVQLEENGDKKMTPDPPHSPVSKESA